MQRRHRQQSNAMEKKRDEHDRAQRGEIGAANKWHSSKTEKVELRRYKKRMKRKRGSGPMATPMHGGMLPPQLPHQLALSPPAPEPFSELAPLAFSQSPVAALQPTNLPLPFCQRYGPRKCKLSDLDPTSGNNPGSLSNPAIISDAESDTPSSHFRLRGRHPRRRLVQSSQPLNPLEPPRMTPRPLSPQPHSPQIPASHLKQARSSRLLESG